LLCCAVAKAFGAPKIICVDINEKRLKFAKDYAATDTYVSQRISAEENAKQIIESFGLGDGADAVIDATGAEPCLQTCIHVLRRGGTYCQAGMVSAFSQPKKNLAFNPKKTSLRFSYQAPCHTLLSASICIYLHLLKLYPAIRNPPTNDDKHPLIYIMQGASDITFPIAALCGKELTVRGSFRYKSGDYTLARDLISSDKIDTKRLISKTVAFEEAKQAFHDVKAAKGIKILIEGPKV
jgi:threonine dehydrogenase-like Zn-dependent dehydrogenase